MRESCCWAAAINGPEPPEFREQLKDGVGTSWAGKVAGSLTCIRDAFNFGSTRRNVFDEHQAVL